MDFVVPFADYAARVEQHIESRYGIRVRTVDVPDPLTGDLDGCEIQIDIAVTDEQRLFLLLHLFGHTVQWNVSPRAFEIGQPRTPPVEEAEIPDLMRYEAEAASYALGMLKEIDLPPGVAGWLCSYTACDMAYLKHYYLTGEKRSFLSFWQHDAISIAPRAVPPFTPVRRTFRRDGIVI